MNTLKAVILEEIKKYEGMTFKELNKLSFCDESRLREVLNYMFNDGDLYEIFTKKGIIIKAL